MSKFVTLITVSVIFLMCSCGQDGSDDKSEAVLPTAKEIQEMLLTAQPGDTVLLPEGTFSFTRTLSFEGIDNVTIKGGGIDKTILSFKNQEEGAEGIRIAANNTVVEDITVQDMDGDGIKAQGVKNVTFRRVKVEWTAGSDTANGGYGLYPVDCDKLLIEHCQLHGASDAGIYAGQSNNVTIRENFASGNVQGIAIENCTNVKVYKNRSTGNTVGISIYNLPELPIVKNGHSTKVYNNEVYENNHWNFGVPGAIVGMVPAGTGIFVLAGNLVEVYENKVSDHQTVNSGIISYPLTGRTYKDDEYIPYTRNVSFHDNEYQRTQASSPDTTKRLGALLAGIFGEQVPDIVFDGIVDPIKAKWGLRKEKDLICVKDNGDATFANINAPSEFTKVSTDKKPFDCTIASF